MSVFSSSVKSHVIDPVFTSANRCEFRLANRGDAFMPTMRIGNLGLTNSGANNQYHFGLGAASIITRIQLLDGNEELDSLRKVGNWLTFKNSLNTNSQNDNVFKNMIGSSLGWATGATGELLSNDNKLIRPPGDASTLGTLDLREVFGILNSISHLSTKLFPNLRVVMEYHLANDAMVNNLTNAADLAKSVPILIVDEIVDEALVASLDKQLTTASWLAIEHDQSQMPQVPGVSTSTNVDVSAVQTSNLRINGFQNKAVSRLMVSKVYQNISDYVYDVDLDATTSVAMKGLAQYGSKALHKEEFNLRVNGRNVLAGQGLTSPASTTMLCSDTWGDMNMCPGANTESVGIDSKYSLGQLTLNNATLHPPGRPCYNWVGVNETFPRILTQGGVPVVSNFAVGEAGATWTPTKLPKAQQGVWVGNSSWIGCNIQERVSDLQLQITRTGTSSSPRTSGTQDTDSPTSSVGNFQALDILCFAEISKRIDIANGQYKISYN